MSTYVLPQDSTVLVTGANGYIASHVVDQLLQAGFRVRGTVRSPKPWLNEYFDQKYGKGRFETVLVSDFSHVPTLEAAVQGVSGIAHLVSCSPLRLLYMTSGIANRAQGIRSYIRFGPSSCYPMGGGCDPEDPSGCVQATQHQTGCSDILIAGCLYPRQERNQGSCSG